MNKMHLRNPIGESIYNKFKIMTIWHVKYF